MTPIELILWALAAAVAIFVVGFAVAIVLFLTINTVRTAGKKKEDVDA